MPELLTRRETPQSVVGRLAGFNSDWWPDLFRNGGRHQFGTMAGFPSEYLAGFNRNPQSASRSFRNYSRAYPQTWTSIRRLPAHRSPRRFRL